MNKLKKLLLVTLTGALFTGCLKTKYDTPPDTSKYDPNIPTNVTISQLANMALNMSSSQYRTLGDSTVSGVVIADDRSGNFYKQMVIQDSTGGITLLVSQTDLYADYPIGRKIYVKLKDLIIINYNGLPEIGFSSSVANGKTSFNGIPTALINTHIVKANYPVTVTPITKTLSDLIVNPKPYLNMLVRLDNMEFDSSSANVTYAQPSIIAVGTPRTVRPYPNPFNTTINLYNSGYATFQPAITPNGKGTLIGIFSIYNSFQFLIRDTSDVQFVNSRDCD